MYLLMKVSMNYGVLFVNISDIMENTASHQRC